jgi:hypothetical protein
MGGKALLIVLLGFFATIGVVRLRMAKSSTDMAGSVSSYYTRQTAQNLAQGGVVGSEATCQ